jgi:indolepyruvate ferredoxin oxidoreductase
MTAPVLEEKYALESGRVYLTGVQALVRLPLAQRQWDARQGLDTAGFVSGYRGSPLGGLDQALWAAQPVLDAHHVRFQPGLNEDLAATAVWGTQQLGLGPGARHDGVFAMWYAKGPGVDRSGDVLRHANFAGTSRHGGVLALAGDDHACKSSSTPHQSEHAFIHAMIPVLNPAGVQEILDYGLMGWAMSRYSGCWIAMKTIAETMDSSASVHVGGERFAPRTPADFAMPPDGPHIRWPDPPLAQEYRLMKVKLYAALAFARANRLDRVVIAGTRPRIGIVTAGKSYLDVRQALDDLEITPERAAALGLAVYKVAMTWPLEPEGIRAFAEGLDEIVVVEEKRALIENQLKEQLYNWMPGIRPRVVGKFDEKGDWILPSTGELSPAQIAVVIGRRLLAVTDDPALRDRIALLDAQERRKATPPRVERKPTFCSGCPHNTSTVVPAGSRALAGIGCHYLAMGLNRRTETFTQMGGEGVAWVGQAPFTSESHLFANLGDGTYYHSGSLAVRQAIAAGVTITYKILFNDAVAMTGGQPVDGHLTVPMIARSLAVEGASRIVVVTDEPGKYTASSGLPPGTAVEHRDALDRVQRQLREVEGVSILLYDQTCATEKRRRRKRGRLADPPVRLVINPLVCEACGDCSVQSNCMSVVPLETEFGRKRQIDQSSCNKDFSCLKGFCPSFVTVRGGRPRRPPPLDAKAIEAALPNPTPPSVADRPWSCYIAGVGGTGVVTLGALLGVAAHIEGKGVGVLDMTGMAQKGGSVTSHVRIGATPEALHAVRIAAGGADAVIGCDIVVAGGGDCLSKIRAGHTRAVVNTHEAITLDFMTDRDFVLPVAALSADIAATMAGGDLTLIDATRLAVGLIGDGIATNPLMLGYAWQRGLIPLRLNSLLQAIEINGVAVAMNRTAFLLGRLAAHDGAAVAALMAERERAAPAVPAVELLRPSATVEERIARRQAYLNAYQDTAYGDRYRALVERVAAVEKTRTPGRTGLAEAVARTYFKLLAYKDEYEVARLYTETGFLDQLHHMFEGDLRVQVNLAPPVLGALSATGGRPRKWVLGPWVWPLLRGLARLRWLRGTAFDPFGWTAERRTERRLIAAYEDTVSRLLAGLSDDRHALAVEIAALPSTIRGFGPVKGEDIARAEAEHARLMARYGAADTA